MTRSRVIQWWFAAVALATVLAVALGVPVTMGTAALLVTVALTPAAVVLRLWPETQALTAAQGLHGGDR